MIDGHGAGGFRFASMSHRGLILVLPSGICAASLEAVLQEAPGSMEHLLIGTGCERVPLNSALRQLLLHAGIVSERMPAGAARAPILFCLENGAVSRRYFWWCLDASA
jgi:uncharacterized protein